MVAEESSGATTYVYDANGNQRSVEQPNSDLTTYTWSFENQMVKTELPDNSETTYTYAPVTKRSDELRITMETVSGITNYIWDQENIIREVDDLGSVEAEYTLNPQPYGHLVSQHRDTDSSYYHYDALGSTQSLTDQSATVENEYVYAPFGKELTSTGTVKNDYTFVGKLGYIKNNETGQYYVRARTTEADQAQWLSKDPIGFAAGDENLYRFASNNPVLIADPSGMRPTARELQEVLSKLPVGGYAALHRDKIARLFPANTNERVLERYWKQNKPNVEAILQKTGMLSFRIITFDEDIDLDIDEENGTTSFTAGQDSPGGPHTVIFNGLDHWKCDALLKGAVAGRMSKESFLAKVLGNDLNCAGLLLWSFLGFGKAELPKYCKESLFDFVTKTPKPNNWLKDQIENVIRDKADCTTSGNIDIQKSWYNVEIFKSGFKSQGKELNKDLFGAFGKFDEIHLDLAVQFSCGESRISELGSECCDCDLTVTGKIGFSDLYDFITTLPKPLTLWKNSSWVGRLEKEHRVYTAFWCASILEALGEGRVFPINFSLDLPQMTMKTEICKADAPNDECDLL